MSKQSNQRYRKEKDKALFGNNNTSSNSSKDNASQNTNASTKNCDK